MVLSFYKVSIGWETRKTLLTFQFKRKLSIYFFLQFSVLSPMVLSFYKVSIGWETRVQGRVGQQKKVLVSIFSYSSAYHTLFCSSASTCMGSVRRDISITLSPLSTGSVRRSPLLVHTCSFCSWINRDTFFKHFS